MANTTYTAAVIVEVETSGLDEGTRKLVDSGKVTEQVGKKYEQLGKKIDETGKEIRDLGNEGQKLKPPKPEVLNTFVSLRKRVKEAKEEVQRLIAEGFDPFSKEVLAAQRNAGQLADELDDLNRQVALLGDDNKLKAVSNLGTSIGSAFGVATGALQLFGAESEEAREIAQKFQGALNIVQGLGSITALKDTFKDLRVVLGITTTAQTTLNAATGAGAVSQTALTGATVATTGATNAASGAMRGFAAALSATGIGAIVVAIGALIGAMVLLGRETDETSKKSARLLEIEAEAKRLAGDRIAAERALKVARGELSTDEAKSLETQEQGLKLIQDQVDALAKFKAENKELFRSFQEVQRIIEKTGGSIDEAFNANEQARNFLAEFRALENNIVEARKTAQLQSIAVDTEALNAQKKAAADRLKQEQEDNKKRTEDAKKDALARAKARVDAELKALQDGQAAIDAFQASQAGLQAQFERELQTQLAGIQAEGNLKKLQNEVTYFGQVEKLAEVNLRQDIQNAEDRIAKLEEFNQTDTEQYQQALIQRDLLNKQYNALLIENKKKTSEQEAALDKERTDEINKELELRRQLAFDSADKILNATAESFEFFTQLSRQAYDEDIAALEENRARGIVSEEQYQAKLKQIKTKAAQADKNAQIFQATLSAAQSILNALTVKPATAIPAAVAFASVTSALNLAKIIATPLPKFKRGTLSVPGLDGGQDSVMAMLRPGEAVIPTETNRAYAPAIAAIYRKQIKPSDINAFVLSRLSGKAGLGREAALTASVDTFALGKALSRNKGVEVTNAGLVGKAIATELANTYNRRRA